MPGNRVDTTMTGMAIEPDILGAAQQAEQRVPQAVTALRRIYGMSASELALRTGIKRPTLTNKLQGRPGSEFTASELRILSLIFDVPIDLFYEGEEGVLRWTLEHPEISASGTARFLRNRCWQARHLRLVRVSYCTPLAYSQEGDSLPPPNLTLLGQPLTVTAKALERRRKQQLLIDRNPPIRALGVPPNVRVKSA